MEVMPWLTTAFGSKEPGSLVLEVEAEEGITAMSLIRQLANQYGEFGKLVFPPINGEFTTEISVILNGHLLGSAEEFQSQLKGGDNLVLVPPFEGG